MKFSIFNFQFSEDKKRVGGQVALIVLLVSAVVMTIGLSMSEKAVVETKIDTDEELLKKAFNAAESGIDYYRGTGEESYDADDGRSSAMVEVSDLGGGEELIIDNFTAENGTVFFWLVGHDADDNIDEGSVYGGASFDISPKADFEGSLKVSYFYKDGLEYKVKRFGFNYGADNTVANFEAKSGDTTIDVLGTPLLVAVTPIFEGTQLSLKGSENFPVQGEEIRATGEVDDESMGVIQKVRVRDVYRVPAFMLDGMTAVNGSIE